MCVSASSPLPAVIHMSKTRMFEAADKIRRKSIRLPKKIQFVSGKVFPSSVSPRGASGDFRDGCVGGKSLSLFLHTVVISIRLAPPLLERSRGRKTKNYLKPGAFRDAPLDLIEENRRCATF